jgi:hypothetical protein
MIWASTYLSRWLASDTLSGGTEVVYSALGRLARMYIRDECSKYTTTDRDQTLVYRTQVKHEIDIVNSRYEVHTSDREGVEEWGRVIVQSYVASVREMLPYKDQLIECPGDSKVVSLSGSRLGPGRQGRQLHEWREEGNKTNLHDKSMSLGPTLLAKAVSCTKKKESKETRQTRTMSPLVQGLDVKVVNYMKRCEGKKETNVNNSPPRRHRQLTIR